MLTPKESLEQEALDNGVDVVTCPLPGPMASVYVRDGEGPPVIAIAKGQDTGDAAWGLAQALGHHHLHGGNIVTLPARQAIRQQRRAQRYAHRRLLPVDALAHALYTCDGNPYAAAEQLGLPVRLLEEAIAAYRDHQGTRPLQTARYAVRFYPWLEIHPRAKP